MFEEAYNVDKFVEECRYYDKRAKLEAVSDESEVLEECDEEKVAEDVSKH